jgi:hypothetical protein
VKRKAGAVAVDSASVYCATELGKVFRFSKTDGTTTTVASVDNVGFDQLAVDDRSVYALSLLSGIYRLGKKGWPPLKLVPVNREVVNFVTDDLDIFWSNYKDGTVMRRRK